MPNNEASKSTILQEREIPAPPYYPFYGLRELISEKYGLFNVEQKMMNVSDARAAITRIGEHLPDDWLELSNLASAYYVLGYVDKALELYEQVLKKERNVSTLLNAAVIYETYGWFKEALELSREANHLDPKDPYAGVLYANDLLRLGRWAEAWPSYVHYCANFDWLRSTLPEWRGVAESIRGKKLLVLDEGGFGDNIFFFRWMPLLKELGAHITLKCPVGFASLVEDYPFIDDVVGGGPYGTTVEVFPGKYDLFTSILDLGLHFGITLENYYWTGPYIHTDKRKFRYSHRTVPRIGLCWKSGENVSPRKHRSLTAEQVCRIADSVAYGKCEWTSLTYDELPPVDMNIPQLGDWSDTATILSGCDLVISTDTGVAHLAGAMGIPTWVMLPGISAWQFLLGCDRHPLYPSMRMFRNVGEGIDNAVDLLCQSLKRRIS